MKRIFAVVFSLMMLLVLSGVSLAEPVKKQHLKKSELTEGLYVSVQGGAAFLTDSDVTRNRTAGIETDLGGAIGVAAGYRIGALDKRVRVEGEVGYQKNCVDDDSGLRKLTGDIKAYSFLVNGYFDFVKGKKIVPFITAGIGVAKVDADINRFTHVDDTGLAYQIGAGIAYHLSDNWHIDLKYRYFDTFSDLGGGNTNPEFTTNNVFLGLRYRF